MRSFRSGVGPSGTIGVGPPLAPSSPSSPEAGLLTWCARGGGVTRRRTGLPPGTKAGRPAGALSASDPAPDRALELSETYAVVRRALDALPESQREVILLAYFGGYSQSEIAARLSEPLGTVKTRVRTGMQKLREVLSPYTPGVES